jgi:hypothetical protein
MTITLRQREEQSVWAKNARECLKLADKMSKLVQNNDGTWGQCLAAAVAYDKARGL